MDKKYDSHNLAKLFGVENMVTPKTLLTEKDKDIRKKPPHEAQEEIRKLLDEINVRVLSKDVIGICECIAAIKLRINYLEDTANQIRKELGL